MKWATRELIHFDRIASAWLILRFIDPDATFAFLKEDQHVGDETRLFGVPGVQLAMHDSQNTTFQRILEAYSITGEAIDKFSEIVTEGVQHVMHDTSQADLSKRAPLLAGALAFVEGIFVTSGTDQECLERCLPLWDALYARLLVQLTLSQNVSLSQQSMLTQTLAIAKATSMLRQKRLQFTEGAFAEALSAASAPNDV